LLPGCSLLALTGVTTGGGQVFTTSATGDLAMNDKDILAAVAESILSAKNGYGYWRTVQADREKPDIENCLKGLKVGDSVFSFDDEDCQIEMHKVVCVSDGVGYIVRQLGVNGRPGIHAVHDDYCRTKADAVLLYRDDIDESIALCERDIKSNRDSIRRLKKYLSMLPSKLDERNDA